MFVAFIHKCCFFHAHKSRLIYHRFIFALYVCLVPTNIVWMQTIATKYRNITQILVGTLCAVHKEMKPTSDNNNSKRKNENEKKKIGQRRTMAKCNAAKDQTMNTHVASAFRTVLLAFYFHSVFYLVDCCWCVSKQDSGWMDG